MEDARRKARVDAFMVEQLEEVFLFCPPRPRRPAFSRALLSYDKVILLYLDKVVKRESGRVFIFMIRFFCAFVQKGEMISRKPALR